VQGKVFALTTANAEEGNEIIQCILSLYGVMCVYFFILTLIIAPHVICHVHITRTIFPYYLVVYTSGGVVLMGSEVLQNCEIKVYAKECPGDLVVLGIRDFDLILSMDWLS